MDKHLQRCSAPGDFGRVGSEPGGLAVGVSVRVGVVAVVVESELCIED